MKTENRCSKNQKVGRPKYPFELIMVSIKVPKNRKQEVLDFNKKIIKEELDKYK